MSTIKNRKLQKILCWCITKAVQFLGCILLCLVLSILYSLIVHPYPSVPPLLKGISSHGGWWGACPPRNEFEQHSIDIAHPGDSPDLNQRLMTTFPPGTSEAQLISSLKLQHFKMFTTCENDPSIHIANFKQNGGGLFHYPMFATLYWKIDEKGDVVWMRGFVAFDGL